MKEKLRIVPEEIIFLWVQALIKKAEVIAPVSTGDGKFAFEKVTNSLKIRLDYDTTTIPPTQKLFMPVGEKVVDWKKVDGKTVFTPVSCSEKTIVFGIHPCDIHAIKAWDDALGPNQGVLADPQYCAKRAGLGIIGLDYISPPPNSFCESVGTHTVESGYDIMLTDLRSGYYFVEIATKRGKRMAGFLTGWYSPADVNDIKWREYLREKNRRRYPKTLPIPIEKVRGFLEDRINHPYYQKTGELCVACAKCTVVCPTCTCCNLREEPSLDGQSGSRVRECDSCQLPCFTKMAGGAIARKTPGERVRHRILDKFYYSHGIPTSCVGCGRCVAICPADIADPVKALSELKEEVPHE